LVPRGTCFFQDTIRNICITLHHPFTQFPQRAHNHFIDVTELCLFCILFFRNNTCDLYLFKILTTKLRIHFQRKYRTKQNTALESKAAFVHLNCSNSRERKVCLLHSYCKYVIIDLPRKQLKFK
jgi:hypothetical protein